MCASGRSTGERGVIGSRSKGFAPPSPCSSQYQSILPCRVVLAAFVSLQWLADFLLCW